MVDKASKDEFKKIFNEMKDKISCMDPTIFCERNLTLDGKPFTINGNGYKPLSDIYRYIGIKALEIDAKPLIIVASRQIGKSTTLTALEGYFLGSGQFGNGIRPPIRIIHAFPTLEHSSIYSKTKFNEMMSTSRVADDDKKAARGSKPKTFMQNLLDKSTPTNDSLTFKQFIGGNHIFIDSIGISGDRIRGRTADVLFFDEVQDMTMTAITNSTKVLNSSKYGKPTKGVQVYVGTPKKKGSDYYKMWQNSSQQYYYLGCEECKQHFPLYTPDSDEWEKIWLHGFIVKCTHCGHEQDKRPAAERGKWVSSKDDADCIMVGYHINQLYMPFATKESVLAEKPGIHPINTERAYRNEVLGEFFQGDSSPISLEEIHEKCGEVGRKFSARIEKDQEQMVIMGIDYGAKSDMEQMSNPDKAASAGQSFTAAVIMSVKGPKLFSIEYCTKFKRNDIESKKGIIEKLMNQYNVDLTIGDIGFSQDFSTMMHQSYGDKYLVSRAHNKVNNHIKYTADAFPKEIVFERDIYYQEVIELLKNGNIKFPYGSYDHLSWLVQHCCNLELKPTMSRYGDPTMHYAKAGNTDGLAALVNAYIAYKFLVTQGFTEMNPLLQKTNLHSKKKETFPILLGRIKRSF